MPAGLLINFSYCAGSRLHATYEQEYSSLHTISEVVQIDY